MLGIGKSSEVGGISELKLGTEGFMKIKPETGITFEQSKNFLESLFKPGMPSENIEKKGFSLESEKNSPILNKELGLEREKEVKQDLEKQYPSEKGYTIISEAYLRDQDGKIVVDPISGERRRIDFVVTKEGKAVDSIEVTSITADKDGQMAKENRIREAGGTYIKNPTTGELVSVKDISTRIERRS